MKNSLCVLRASAVKFCHDPFNRSIQLLPHVGHRLRQAGLPPAKRLGYNRLALTDTDNLYGLWPFLRTCRREGLTPIVGAEVTEPHRPQRAVCLVEDDTGYRNLCRLLTRRHMDDDFDLETVLPDHAPGLVVLTQDPTCCAPGTRPG